jgi:predicted Zn-dependent protease
MDRMPLKNLLAITTVFLLVWSSAAGQQAFAQSRLLPKAGFNNYSAGRGPLPPGSGLTLQEGQERPKNAPPEVYNPGEPKLDHKLVRWEARHMPLKIWVSPGKKLVEESISTINAQRPQEVLQLLKTDPTFSSLSPCRGWDQMMSSAAKTGIEQWKEFENEGLFSFVFVDDPSQANIFLFWAEKFTGDEGAGGVSTGGNTVAVLYDACEVHSREASIGQPLQGTPIIIELQVLSGEYDRLQARAAHEFGHALGIKEHSPYNEDLMCVNGIARLLSNSDRATIRWLYRQRPQYVMLPPVLPQGGAQPIARQPQGSGQGAEAQDEGGSLSGQTGTYRVRFSRREPTPADSPEADVPTGASPSSPDAAAALEKNGTSGRNSPLRIRKSAENVVNETKEAKKQKEGKSKHRKGADDSLAPSQSATPAPDGSAPPRPKASEGF